MKVISSQDNKLIKLASSLKHKKYRDEHKMFLVEGKRAVEEVQERPELLEALFLDESQASEHRLECMPLNPECYLVDDRLMKNICSTENPQGIAALVRKPAWSWEDVLGKKGLLLLLDRVSDPGNMGSILRTSWALGVDGVLMTKGCVDPFSPKVVRATMGAIINIPVFQEVSQQQLDSLIMHGYRFLCTEIYEGEKYYSVKYDRASVIIIGSEAQGVSDDIKRRCNQFINIPMNPQVDSLNVAAACAIIVAEAWRQCHEASLSLQ